MATVSFNLLEQKFQIKWDMKMNGHGARNQETSKKSKGIRKLMEWKRF